MHRLFSKKRGEEMIKISDKVSLPLDAITQTFAQIGRKGSGKTYLASMIAEQMIDAGGQVIVIDPIGNWWGLRVDKDGRSKGKDIFIVGGRHGDVPLSPEAGVEIAELLVNKNISAVLDISEFRKNERKRFVTDFAEEFYHLKKANSSAVHIFLEEAQKFCPQKPQKDEARMLGAWEDIVRLGRNCGIGCSLITQRPQSVNKEVLSQVECLCVLQVTGLHERKALEGWIQEAGEDRKIIGELPSFQQGEGYIWSPAWLKIFKKVKFSKKTTFDTSSTPKLGEATKTAKISRTDIDKLKNFMTQVIETSKEEKLDKDTLVKEVRRLKMDVKILEKSKPKPKPEADEVLLHSVAEKNRAIGYNQCKKEMESEITFLRKENTLIIKRDEKIAEILKVGLPPRKDYVMPKYEPSVEKISLKEKPEIFNKKEVVKEDFNNDEEKPPKAGAMKILGWLAGAYPEPLTKQRIATLSGFSVNGGTFGAYISVLRKRGWLTGDKDELFITEEGLQNVESLSIPTGDALLNLWKGKFKAGVGKMLQVLYDSYPNTVTREELAEETGFEITGGTFGAYLSKLRKNKLIEEDDDIKISEEFFA